MSLIRLSNRYAKSLLDLAQEQGKLDVIKKDVELMLSIMEGSPDFFRMLRSPIIHSDKKRSVIRAVLTGKVNDLTLRFIDLLTRKLRERHLRVICRQFIVQYNELKRIKPVTLITAVPVAEAVRVAVMEKVHDANPGHTIELITETDPDIVGGYILRYDDRQYDASVSYHLQLMNNEFEKNVYVRGF
jgi:F-type H+-transporting ATPase subunit delta